MKAAIQNINRADANCLFAYILFSTSRVQGALKPFDDLSPAKKPTKPVKSSRRAS
jgi:hypothetical protein